jgi:hypothetical protein
VSACTVIETIFDTAGLYVLSPASEACTVHVPVLVACAVKVVPLIVQYIVPVITVYVVVPAVPVETVVLNVEVAELLIGVALAESVTVRVSLPVVKDKISP